MAIQFLQPDGLVRSPAFSHAAVVPADATMVDVGGQNGVDGEGLVVDPTDVAVAGLAVPGALLEIAAITAV